MDMNDYIISEDIYKDSLILSEDSYKISDEIFEESISLNMELLKKEELNSYKLSGRYWIWRIGMFAYKNLWDSMVDNGEMSLEAPGLKYFKSYPTLGLLEDAYAKVHPDKKGITVNPAAYYAFANYLRKGDVVIVYNSVKGIVGWGIIESDYIFRPTRKTGRHYRKAMWCRMQMPFYYTNKKAALYRIPKEETLHLSETLVGKVYNDKNSLPFGSVERKDKKKIDSKINTCFGINVKRSIGIQYNKNSSFEKSKMLGSIISSLLASF